MLPNTRGKRGVIIGHLYLFYQIVKEVWDVVKEMYLDLKDMSPNFEVRSKIRNTRQGTSSVTEYFNMLSKLWQQIDLFHNIEWKEEQFKSLVYLLTESRLHCKFGT